MWIFDFVFSGSGGWACSLPAPGFDLSAVYRECQSLAYFIFCFVWSPFFNRRESPISNRLVRNGLDSSRQVCTFLNDWLESANTANHILWIVNVLRPFGHLSIVDGLPSVDFGLLMSKAISLHTEMVFSRIMHGFAPKVHGEFLKAVADFVIAGKMQPIVTEKLEALTPETMKTAHTHIEAGRTVGKIVIEV